MLDVGFCESKSHLLLMYFTWPFLDDIEGHAVVVVDKLTCVLDQMHQIQYNSQSVPLTKLHILIFVPKSKVLFDHLLTVKFGCVPCKRCDPVRGRKYPLAPLKVRMTHSLDIARVPLGLAECVMSIAVKPT